MDLSGNQRNLPSNASKGIVVMTTEAVREELSARLQEAPKTTTKINETATMATTTTTTNEGVDTAKSLAQHDHNLYYKEDWAHFAGNETIRYRVPHAMVDYAHHEQDPILLVGVLSNSKKRYERDLARHSWANHNHSSLVQVYYVASGPFEDIQAEFEQEQDMIWVDYPEEYKYLLAKVKTMLVALHTHANPSYQYILKNDDDQYTRLWATLEMLQEDPYSSAQYIGCCYMKTKILRRKHRWGVPHNILKGQKFFPPFANGGCGYVLKQSFVEGLVTQEFPQHESAVENLEDASMGIHAKALNVTCTYNNGYKVSWGGPRLMNLRSEPIYTIHSFKPGGAEFINGVKDVHFWDCCFHNHKAKNPTCSSINCQDVPPGIPLSLLPK